MTEPTLFDLPGEPAAAANGAPICFNCRRHTRLELVIADGSSQPRRIPCCFNRERGCDAAANKVA